MIAIGPDTMIGRPLGVGHAEGGAAVEHADACGLIVQPSALPR